MNAFSHDRSFFFHALCTKPLFLIRHVPFLVGAIFSKLRNYLKMKGATTHQGCKSWPLFLDVGRLDFQMASKGSLGLLHLPSYAVSDGSYCFKEASRPLTEDADGESYFMQNRWGGLLSLCLDQSKTPIDCGVFLAKWMDEHGDKELDAAWEAYSASERVVNLLVYLAVKPNQSVDVQRDVFKFIGGSLEWIYQHLEYYGERRTNNHILNNARALIVGGAAIGNTFSIVIGMRIFRKLLPKMILQHGMLRERSSHYQLIVLNWVLDALMFMKSSHCSNLDDIRFLQTYADKMSEAATFLCNSEGQLLGMVGDVSPDISPLNVSVRLKGLYSEYWVCDTKLSPQVEYKDGWFSLASGASQIVGNFPEGSYPMSFPTHGHSDYTGFCWVDEGKSILVDPGRYRYTSDDVSIFQKNVEGHNVPLVNGFSVLSGSLLCAGEWYPRPYACAELKVVSDAGKIVLSHDGFFRATPVCLHTRSIVLNMVGLEVIDFFNGTGEVDIDFLWNFASGFKLSSQKSLSLEDAFRSIEVILSNALSGEDIQYCSAEILERSLSLSYGIKEPAIALRLSVSAHLPISIKTSFKLGDICVE